MAQHDYNISNQSGAAFRADLNNALSAIVSNNSGAVEPSTTYAYQFWADTTAGVLKQRNAANSAWVTLFQLDGEWSTIALENGTGAAPSLYFKDSGTDTGLYSPGVDQLGVATAGVQRVNFNGATEVVFNDTGADVDFRIEGDTEPNLFVIDAGTDQVRVKNLNGGPLAGTRNRIINGDFRVWQRGTTFTNVTGTTYTADRFCTSLSGINFTVTQDTDVPSVQFKYSLKAVPTSSATPTEAVIRQFIEQQNVYDFAGQSVTGSAWIKCSKSQVRFRLGPQNATGGVDSAQTISVTAGTWTKISFTFSSYAAVTAWTATPTDSAGSLDIGFVNSTALTISDYIFITGIQLERGSVVTPFECRSYGQELALCQRYFYRIDSNASLYPPIATSTGARRISITFPVTMRAAPTMSAVSVSNIATPSVQVTASAVQIFGTAGADTECGLQLSGTNNLASAEL
jgi:hypothetical protein